MASLQQLSDDIMRWANRRDIADAIPGYVAMVETELAETLRARCQVTSGIQQIDAPYISLPTDFATMESIRDAETGELLVLKDSWSGHWSDAYQPYGWQVYDMTLPSPPNGPAHAYRLMHDCIEFLPHPLIPDPPDPTYKFQSVQMAYYAKPRPLLLPTDTNAILEQHYGVYLFGTLKFAAMFELDDDRVAQADAAYQQHVTRANLWQQQSQYSGAPLRAELAVTF